MSGLGLRAFAAAVGGRLVDPHGADAPFVPSTDSRTIAAGETFVCLRGPTFDGHDHIEQALARGAAGVIIDRIEMLPSSCGVPVVLTRDAKEAYLLGAAEARRRSRAVVVGVTGSTGKTTTKEFARQIIARRRRVLASPQNENNELGVAHLCYRLSADVDVAIVEMGARHPGEIGQLVDIARPDVGILTNVGEAHLEFFRDQEELARTKFALFQRGARAVCSAADAWSRSLAAEAGIERAATWVRLCGDPPASGLMLEAGAASGGRVPLTLGASHAFAAWHLVGDQHLRDALLAAAAAVHCGLSFEEATAGFGDLQLPAGRFEVHALTGGAIVVYDAYNASPASVVHALHAFGEIPAKRRIAVLGTMAELGRDAAARHEATGAAAASALLDKLYCGGEFGSALATGALRAGMRPDAVATYETNEDVTRQLRRDLRDGDAVLLKGSRVQKMEQILAALLANASSKDAMAS